MSAKRMSKTQYIAFKLAPLLADGRGRVLSPEQISELVFDNPFVEVSPRELGEVARLLREVYGLPVHPVSKKAFKLSKRNYPTSLDDAVTYLPIGYNKKTAGIRLAVDEDDLLYRRWLQQANDVAAGVVKAERTSILVGMNSRVLPYAAAVELEARRDERGTPALPNSQRKALARAE